MIVIDPKSSLLFRQDESAQTRLTEKRDAVAFHKARKLCGQDIPILPVYSYDKLGCVCSAGGPGGYRHGAGHGILRADQASSDWAQVSRWLTDCPGISLRAFSEGRLWYLDYFDETPPFTRDYYSQFYHQRPA